MLVDCDQIKCGINCWYGCVFLFFIRVHSLLRILTDKTLVDSRGRQMPADMK